MIRSFFSWAEARRFYAIGLPSSLPSFRKQA